jgi:hypothetical protein
MRTELRVENVENIVRLAATNISQIQVQMQVNNGELIVCPVVTVHSHQPPAPKSARSISKSRVRPPRGTPKTVSACPDCSTLTSHVFDAVVLGTLNPVSSATWQVSSTEGCTPDTRVLLLDEIMSWVDDPAGSCVFWLNGLAGTGKSTIARSLCQRLKNRSLLGANFFVDRQRQDRRNSSNIVRTLAHQLALRQRSVAAALCSELRERPAFAPRSLETEIEDFICQPSHSLSDTASLVIVLDALDECLTDIVGRPGGDLVLSLVRQLIGLSGRLKLFITSRAEPSIQQMFDDLTTHSQHTVVRLHDLDQTVVEQDIRTYLLDAFRQIRVRRTSLNLSDWPLAEDLERLVQDSGSLFVYASTVIRFVGNLQHSPRARLAQVLGQQQTGVITKPYATLDKLYRQILVDATKSSDEDEVEDEDEICDALCHRLRNVLAVVVLAQTPLRVDALAVLADLSHDDAHIAVQSLSALLLVDGGERVQTFHPSFPDFLTDSARCTDTRLCVDPAKHHANLGLRCMMVMNDDLRYDMCHIGDPNLSNADVADLQTRLRESMSDALQYACSFWPVHLTASGHSDDNVNLWDALVEFTRKHLFHWLEVLSLLQRLPMAEVQLLETIQWCEVCYAWNIRTDLN